MYGEQPNILKYISTVKASGNRGLIKDSAGSSLAFTPDETELARLNSRNYITRLGPIYTLFREGVESLSDTRIAIRNVRSSISNPDATPSKSSAYYDNIRCRNGLESQCYLPEKDTSDETDPFLVAAHIAIGLHQFGMRNNKLIDPLHTSFTTVVLYLCPGELIGCSTAIMTAEFLRAAKAKTGKQVEGSHIVYEPTTIAVDSTRFKDLLAHIQDVVAAQDGTPMPTPIPVLKKKRRSTDTTTASQSSGATSSV
ncbi:hypothetical protein Q9L58_010107 [Maublancomyces gigas]|uniref:Fido domain-containing protein n=1 Tax=Discina gigas TaxID=1032678 RepID=A0ABR3G514_9PEZI